LQIDDLGFFADLRLCAKLKIRIAFFPQSRTVPQRQIVSITPSWTIGKELL
jgi:hypothetical protein